MQNDQAMKHFRKSSRIRDDIQNYINIAKIELRHNKIKKVKQIIEHKLKEYPDKSELLELYSFILLKDNQINDAQYFARKCLAKNYNSIFALKIMAETCRRKNNFAGAISYWKLIRSLSPRDAFANLALIELYGTIKDTQLLNQEIFLLINLKGSLNLNEYIQQINKDEKLLIYVPKLENYKFVTKRCSFIN